MKGATGKADTNLEGKFKTAKKALRLVRREAKKYGAKAILAGKVRRYFSIQNILDLFKMPIGFLQAFWRRHRFIRIFFIIHLPAPDEHI